MGTGGIKVLAGVVAAISLSGGAALSLRHLSQTWGSTPAERVRVLPGDELVAPCQMQADRAISIPVPAEWVWPWLTQLGQDRGGFYSFEAIENLLGCDIEGASTLHPEWSTRHVGDSVTLAPDMALVVGQVEPNRHLVLTAGELKNSEDSVGQGGDAAFLPDAFTWAFVLTQEGRSCRLHVRERYRFPSTANRLAVGMVPVASVVMTWKMLRTLRRLAIQVN